MPIKPAAFFRFLLFLLLIFKMNSGFAKAYNFQALQNGSYDERLEIIEQIRADKTQNQADTTSFRVLIDSITHLAEKNKNRELLLEGDYLRAVYRGVRFKNDSAGNFAYINQLIGACRKNHYSKLEARMLLFKAQYLWLHFKSFELGFQYMWEAERVGNGIDPKGYYDRAACLYLLGRSYYSFADYRRAIRLFLETLEIPEHRINANHYNAAINTLGLCYQELKMFDSSNYYFNILIHKNYAFGAKVWKDIATGNLGYNYYYHKDYATAYPLLIADYEAAVKRKDPWCASGSSIYLADIYVRTQQLEKAREQIALSRIHILAANKGERYAFLYPVIAQWYLKNGKPDSAAMFWDSATVATERYHEQYSALQLHHASQRLYAMEKETAQLNAEQQKLREINRRNLIISILAVVVLLSFGGYYFQQRRDKEKLRLKDVLIRSGEEALREARARLEAFTKNISDRNALIETFEDKYEPENEPDILKELKSSVILTEQDWENFQALFEKVHQGVLNRLHTLYPNLSASEIRYILLSFLNFSHKEMAAALGISADSLRVTWYRLRKKLELPQNTTVLDLVLELR